ncbi:hypothetical protein PIB30_099531, partial [Stylosanthes scabra]|nr:hypothetical protein [Stylosanthes scabra]
MVRIPSPASSHKQDKPHRQGNRMINLAFQVASPSALILNKQDINMRLCSALNRHNINYKRYHQSHSLNTQSLYHQDNLSLRFSLLSLFRLIGLTGSLTVSPS